MTDAVPVERIAGDARDLRRAEQEGLGLCLSGGGYRAMLFHLGSLWRLNEAALLPDLDRVSSVSGGSIAAGLLGLRWRGLEFRQGVASRFEPLVAAPLRALAGRTIDEGAILSGALLPGAIAVRVEAAFRDHLFGDATLQDLPRDSEGPRFVINATSVQTGGLWRFSRPFMADWRVGRFFEPRVPLAFAVAASCAYPPVLSPARLRLVPGLFTRVEPAELFRSPFSSEAVLTDGGVYDNLGLETVWKRYSTVLASDGGGHLEPEGNPKRDWARHALRVHEIIDNQVRTLRKRQLIGSFKAGYRKGAYWSIRCDPADYGVLALPCADEARARLAGVKTRLEAIDDRLPDQLINWGYAACDVALRAHVRPGLTLPAGFPYPGSPLDGRP